MHSRRSWSSAKILQMGPLQPRPSQRLCRSRERSAAGVPTSELLILAMAMPAGHGEALHNHRTLVATGISVGAFYLLNEDITVLLLEPPTNWWTIAILLGAMNRGATIWAGWDAELPQLPTSLNYVVCGWDRAGMLLDDEVAALTGRISAGLIVAIDRPFSTSRRLRIGRRLRADVMTLLGRSDLGPIVASHPAWYLNDAAGIPLPSVDLRPLNPTDGQPLNIGWEVVDSAELGVKSALAPAGGTLVEGWLRSNIIAQIDPTGFYFLVRDRSNCAPLEANYFAARSTECAAFETIDGAADTTHETVALTLGRRRWLSRRSRRSSGNRGIPFGNHASS